VVFTERYQPDQARTPAPGRDAAVRGAAQRGAAQRGAGAPRDAAPPAASAADALHLLGQRTGAGQLTHVERIPARAGRRTAWPGWLPEPLAEAFTGAGVPAPWEHQVAAADHAWAGRHVIISTGTASGKSLGYLMPALAAVQDGGSVLYIAPSKALAADQFAALRRLGLDGVNGLDAAVFDGDTVASERDWARAHASYLLTNPDMLHHTLLPQHERWARFFRRLRYVVIDECHRYRGVFGSHVAQVLRRLRRVAARHAPPGSARPVFVLASATVSEPAACARLLTGLDAVAVTGDASARGPVTFALCEPPLTALRGEAGAPVRRAATVEAADMLAELAGDGFRTLAFVRSRRAAETVALAAGRRLDETAQRPGGPPANGRASRPSRRVAAYRAGYLAEDRRAVEAALRSGTITGLATTNALELGVDISGLDAVILAGWPGTRASLWQQAGRAGREGQEAVAVLVARDDPLDTYLVHHPEAIFGHPVEATVLDPGNPYVLAPHLCAAAAELPLTEADLDLFGPSAAGVAADLTRTRMLRRRPAGWYWRHRSRAAAMTSIRGEGGGEIQIVEQPTGRLLGTVDEASAHTSVHTGAVYLHQGDAYLVSRLDLADGVALVQAGDPGYTTSARDVTDIEVAAPMRSAGWGEATLSVGEVTVTRQVVSYLRRKPDTGEVLGEHALSLPPRTLRTRAVWWTVSHSQRRTLEAAGVDLAGAAHAAEHASIGLLPLFASCDRWDIGGVSTELHASTGRLTVFVYDGNEGGAGFADRAFRTAGDWLRATRQAIGSCECSDGCPSCIQSPKCGNGNQPLSKPGALALLDCLLAGAD
jgi:DEAD/DEAH box helicase domain-containing protein